MLPSLRPPLKLQTQAETRPQLSLALGRALSREAACVPLTARVSSRLLTEHRQVGALCSSVAQSSLTPWDPMDCSTPGFPVLHRLWGLARTHDR